MRNRTVATVLGILETILLAAGVLAGPGCSKTGSRPKAIRPRAPCLEDLAAFARPVDEALAAFEKGESLADAVLGQALLVREKVESAPVDPACAAARGEVLVYFNHLILGVRGYLRGGLHDRESREKLDSIVRRAREHERRGLGTP